MVKFKEVSLQVGSFLLLVLVVAAVYAFSWFTGGSLTTARSCIGSYIVGEYSLEDARKDCPNLKKEDFLNAVNEHFDQFGNQNTFTSREEMIRDIEQNYQ